MGPLSRGHDEWLVLFIPWQALAGASALGPCAIGTTVNRGQFTEKAQRVLFASSVDLADETDVVRWHILN